ncbi:hypothetical protein [Emticicia sp. C21]|uniref:hypothetical protein n=1 Tax=Emticicia sp. C21 TaxID=2302915 RepID=UPI000E8D8B55|nr:hypothetical protein [Emticicia sp. C21]RFS16085.1 hypothetical protein D0T08_14445 [Emticicia sp. C21]
MKKSINVPMNRDELCTRYGCTKVMLYRWFKKENLEEVLPGIHSIRCFTPNQGEKIVAILDFSSVVLRFQGKQRGAMPYQIKQF